MKKYLDLKSGLLSIRNTEQTGTHRYAILHHWIMQFMPLGCAARKETALTDIIVEML